MIKLPCTIMRGGTSKAVIFQSGILPEDSSLRDRVILAIMGSPDPRQIDGLGGADMLTSKLAIIGKSSRSEADIDYTFVQVGVDRDYVDYSGNCGNISTATGVYAINKGLVPVEEPYTTVRVWNTNTNSILQVKVPIENGKVKYEGDYSIDGVPGTGARIDLDFSQTAGAKTGKLLPTGNSKDVLSIEGWGELEISIVDIGNTTAFVRASDIGLSGEELPAQLEQNTKIMTILEKIRGFAAFKLGFASSVSNAVAESPALPFLAIVSKPSLNSDPQITLKSTVYAVQKIHKAYPVTGAICTAVAAMLEGSVVSSIMSPIDSNTVTIAHPSGTIKVDVSLKKSGNEFAVTEASLGRTARLIMEGEVYIPKRIYGYKE